MTRLSLLIFSNICYVRTANAYDHQKNLEERLKEAKLNLWSRGEHNYDRYYADDNFTLEDKVDVMEMVSKWPPMRLGPIRDIRLRYLNEDDCTDELDCTLLDEDRFWTRIRGGANHDPTASYGENLRHKIDELGRKFGPEFLEAIRKNEEEHARDCSVSCESFYCAPETFDEIEDDTYQSILNGTSFTSYSFGATPPEDFGEEFGFPLDLIKVTKGNPLFSPEEAARVIDIAKDEGVDNNEFKSGKYQLGGDWLTNLPNTRRWFNELLQSKLFPLLPKLFPEIVSSPSVLRAHSVSLLKYNVTHPRTDVHIDNGILAMTLAMTPLNEYEGGGTFFEHMDTIIPMDVGHGTFRPGSVRHGGHKVDRGTRYILGAFLLIEDRVEHVRRLKNRGSELRRKSDLEGAARHFEWALAINPKCTTCLKDWAEILLTQKQYDDAEEKMRRVLELLEDKDSDALFSLGVILSEAGRDDESIDAYIKSVKLNAEDAELCYNLGIKLGAKGDKKAEMAMYARATNVNPKFGGKSGQLVNVE
jgi:tetratricopeptide (TPR) repeat protein